MQEPKGHWNIALSYFLIGESSLVSYLVFYIFFSKWIQPVGYRWIARDSRPSPRGEGPALIRLPSIQREQISLLWASTYKREKAGGYMITGEQWSSIYYYHPVEDTRGVRLLSVFVAFLLMRKSVEGQGKWQKLFPSASLKWQQVDVPVLWNHADIWWLELKYFPLPSWRKSWTSITPALKQSNRLYIKKAKLCFPTQCAAELFMFL